MVGRCPRYRAGVVVGRGPRYRAGVVGGQGGAR